MTFKRVVLLLLAVASIYSAFSTPLPNETASAYLLGDIAGRLMFPIIFLYFAFRKKKSR